MDFYNFKNNTTTDGQSIVHVINLLGDDLIGAEVGVYRAKTFLTFLQNCPNIKKLYGIDRYSPYFDQLSSGETPLEFTELMMEEVKLQAYQHIKYSGYINKVIFFEEDSNEASKKIKDSELDFVFLDSYTSYEQVCNDLRVWYPKVKKGGLFSGHDYHHFDVKRAIYYFTDELNIRPIISDFDNTFCWIKK